jgi:ATP-dependent DNA helicase RecQ
VRRVYNALGNYLQIPLGGGKGQSYDFVLSDFLQNYRFNALEAHSSLVILEKEGYIEMSNDMYNPSRVHFVVERDDLYKFQVSNEKYDGFIKLLLRSYTGLFSIYAGIDEDQLAKRSGLSRDHVYSYLKLLKKQGIIDYIPRRNNPVVTFTEERLDEGNLSLDGNRYRFLKERYLEKLEAMLSYARTDTKCRSQQLLTYFGEDDSVRCGKCDVCNQRNELNLSRQEFDAILAEIKKDLTHEALLPVELKERSSFPVDKFSGVYRWLLEHGKIVPSGEGRYRWNKTRE